MASIATPPRPLPGTWQQTPVPRPLPAPSFQSSQGVRSPFAPNTALSTGFTTRPSQTPSQPQQQASTTAPAATQTLTTAERAARTINETLAGETRFPELDSYLAQGLSAEYDIHSSAPWAPFQKVRIYNIPDQIFEQYNRAQVSTSMGLFAELHYAWVAIDNALTCGTTPFPTLSYSASRVSLTVLPPLNWLCHGVVYFFQPSRTSSCWQQLLRSCY